MCAKSKKSCGPEIKLQHKEALIKCAPLMVRQAHHERNQYLAVRPEPVEGLVSVSIRFLALPLCEFPF